MDPREVILYHLDLTFNAAVDLMNGQDELFRVLNHFLPSYSSFFVVVVLSNSFSLEAFNGCCLHSSGCNKVVGLLRSVSRCREIAEVITEEIP